MSVAILLNLPDDVYRALLKQADRHETQVHLMVETVVIRSVRQPHRTRARKPAAGWPRKQRVRLAAADRAELARLHHEEGLTRAQLAQRFNVSRGTVDNIIQEQAA